MPFFLEFKNLDLPFIAEEILKYWEKEGIFEKSVQNRNGKPGFVFYEGPPSANGLPGIHHVMSRTIKDLFCRFQTLNGKQVKRRAGWDTHGLPIELAVEKTLGITKEDIGKKIPVEEYNLACRREVMKFQDKWETLTRQMGYWVDMSSPYITYENNYIESVWWLLNRLYQKKLLYKGYTIQPYSPKAGTGLSSHELNQPGCYRNVTDTSAVVMFKMREEEKIRDLFGFEKESHPVYFMAWTTTPWTLPSNVALALGKKIEYVCVKAQNPFSGTPVLLVLADSLKERYFNLHNKKDQRIGEYSTKLVNGEALKGFRYEQLLDFGIVPDNGGAFITVNGDFVTTSDGTGIVHIAPSFGADDFKVAKENSLGSLTLVDRSGKFLPSIADGKFLFGSEYVKEAYLNEAEKMEALSFQKEKLKKANGGYIEDTSQLKYQSVDERIVKKLEVEGHLWQKEKYEHSYPHCWRTDKPVLYYPLDSWFVKVTAEKEKLVALNKEIKWMPPQTGSGRFGEWLNNLQDWNLSRSRFWGIPLPIWRTEDGLEEICIDSVEKLKNEIVKSLAAGIMKEDPFRNKEIDLHKPFIDEVFLVSSTGKKMVRESDLIDVWFDSGAMPYAQVHYPFENKQAIDSKQEFPADFIAEGVDQTRGWFYTLHAISTLCFDSVAYKNVVSNGLVLDKFGNKMSKRLGNTIDPFETIAKYGPDAVRWYMVTNSEPWENLKFDETGIQEVQRKFFRALFSTYSFFALYANIDGFENREPVVPIAERSEMDRWIISELNHLCIEVKESFAAYNPTIAGRKLEEFVLDKLSNWYIRLNRRRFWKGEKSQDKTAAYQTLLECLEKVLIMASPIAPFFTDYFYHSIFPNGSSVHLTDFPIGNQTLIDRKLENQMNLARTIASLVFSIRKKENIRVRQPLQKIRIPVISESMRDGLISVKDLIAAEVNVKEIELLEGGVSEIVKQLKLNFKTLGKKAGPQMKNLQKWANENAKEVISEIEKNGVSMFEMEGIKIEILKEDVEIIPVDIPGWKVANEGTVTVALDVSVTPALAEEGLLREFINRVQQLRKEEGFEVTDKINIRVSSHPGTDSMVLKNLRYICAETLAGAVLIVKEEETDLAPWIEIDDQINVKILISKLN